MTWGGEQQAALDAALRDTTVMAYLLGKVAEKPDREWYFKLKQAAPLLFAAHSEPRPQVDKSSGTAAVPFWNVLPFLLGLSRLTAERDDEELVGELLACIREVSERSMRLGPDSGNHHTWSFFVQILTNLPPRHMSNEMLSYVRYWMAAKYGGQWVGLEVAKKLLPKFLRGEASQLPKAQSLFDSLTEFVWVAVPQDKRDLHRGKERIAKTLIEPYFFTHEFVHKGLAKEVGAKCEPQVVLRATKQLMDILDDGRDGYRHVDDVSSVWLPDVASGPSTGDDDPEELYTYLLRELLAGLASTRPGDCRGPLEELMGERYHYPIFRRLAFHTIDLQWRDLRVCFDSKLDHEHLREWLTLPSCRLELLRLLGRHATDLDDTQKQVVAAAVEEGLGPTKNGKPYPVEMEAEWKRGILYGLKEDAFFGLLYEKYRAITENDAEPPPPFRIQIRRGPGSSPCSPQELQSMDGPSLATYLASFTPGDPWNGPTLDGLCDSLKKAVAEDPTGFTPKLPSLIETRLSFAVHIVWGYRDAWKAQKSLDWQRVLDFLSKYTKPEEFWAGGRASANDDRHSDPREVVGMAADLIEGGATQDEHAFNPDVLPMVVELLAGWFSRTKARSPTTATDPLTAAYNTNRGALLRAMVIVALRTGRLLRDKVITGAAAWPIEFSGPFDIGFKQNDPDAYVLFGYYLYNFHFLDWEWATDRLKTIECLESDPPWLSFIYGFLFRGEFNREVHKAMLPSLRRALREPKLDAESRRRLGACVCSGFLRGLDIIGKGGLVDEVLSGWSSEQIRYIVAFLWGSQDYFLGRPEGNAPALEQAEQLRIRSLISQLWDAICDRLIPRLNGTPTEADRSIASASASLCVFLRCLDTASAERLTTLARFTLPGMDATNLVDAMNELRRRGNPKVVAGSIGRAFKALVDAVAPTYNLDHVKDITQYLLDSGNVARPIGKQIRDRYVRMGYFDWADMKPATPQSKRTVHARLTKKRKMRK
jgi:hypothetical protein